MERAQIETESRPSIPGFEVVEALGAGAFGRVFLARETEGLRRTVALKVFHGDRRDAWRRELEAAARVEDLRREHRELTIVQSLAGGEHAGQGWIAFEYVEHGSLKDLVERDGPLAVERALRYLGDAAAAVARLHADGLFHRDVKPANLLLGSDGRVRLGDFGLSREMDGSLSAAGSPAFAPPELIGGVVDEAQRPQVDIYGLGATLSWLLTGASARPGRPDVFALERRRVPRALQQVILAAMAYEPEERPASITALREALEAAVTAGESDDAEETENSPRTDSGVGEEPIQTEDTRMKKTNIAPITAPEPRTDLGVSVERPRCPWCHEAVQPTEAKRACESCMGWQHLDCWGESKSCAACGALDARSRELEAAAATKVRHQPDGRSPRKTAALLLTVVLGTLVSLFVVAGITWSRARAVAEAKRRDMRMREAREAENAARMREERAAADARRDREKARRVAEKELEAQMRILAAIHHGPPQIRELGLQDGGVWMTWEPAATNRFVVVTDCRVLRRVDGGPEEVIARLGPSSVGLLDPDLPAGIKVSYAVESVARLDRETPEIRKVLGRGANMQTKLGEQETRRSAFTRTLTVPPRAGPEVTGDK